MAVPVHRYLTSTVFPSLLLSSNHGIRFSISATVEATSLIDRACSPTCIFVICVVYRTELPVVKINSMEIVK